MQPKIAVVLGSGGLRGISQVGVLKVLEDENIKIDHIVGCSMGSLIGALYCCGHTTDNILKLAMNLKREHWFDIKIGKMGLCSGEQALTIMKLLTQKRKFSETDISLSIVAADLNAGEEVVFSEGSVAEAVRASISIPGVFMPYQKGEMLLVDGAVVNPTPIDIAFNNGADIVIAVDLSYASTFCKINNFFNVIIKSIDIMEHELMKNRINDDKVVMIRPDVGHISPSSFDYMEEAVALGEIAAKEMLPTITELIAKYNKVD